MFKKMCLVGLIILSQLSFAGPVEDYFSFISDITPKRVERTVNKAIIEGVVVSPSYGLLLADKRILNGRISRENIRAISITLYELDDFSVYLYQGLKVIVWYSNDTASNIGIYVLGE